MKAPSPASPIVPDLPEAEAERRAKLVSEVAGGLSEAARRVVDTNLEIENGLVTALRYCGAYDREMKKIYQWASRVAARDFPTGAPMALTARGGYGRRQLNLHSDIDLLFLMPPTGARHRAELELKLVLYVLYDLKIDLGHAALTPVEAVEVIGRDFESATALLELRWLAGDRKLYDDVRRRMRKRILEDPKKSLMREIISRRHLRHKTHGESVYMLEPNIKESEGGLRDLHTAAWLSYACFGDTRLRALTDNKIWNAGALKKARAGRAFLIRLRNELHAKEGRRSDTLRHALQPEIATRLGYEGGYSLAEEKLLSDYYHHARAIFNLTEQAVNLMGREGRGVFSGLVTRLRLRHITAQICALGQVAFLDEAHAQWFRKSPNNIFVFAAEIAERGLVFSERSKDRIRRALESIDDTFRESPENRDSFLRILRSKKNVPYTLRVLHETGALDAYLPEWEHLNCLVRSDYYHAYTVDEHHFKCLEAAEKVRNAPEKENPRIASAVGEIQRWDMLNFALLLHDVGKGLGGAHALRGAQMAERIAFRIGMTDDDRTLLSYLVRYHLKMSHEAQRRDLSDPRVIESFVREVGDLEKLRLLYIHTVCDFRGVGPQAYNDWRAQLLGMLYEQAEQALKGRPPEQLERPRIIPSLMEKLLGILKNESPDPADVERFLDSLPDRYLAEIAPASAAEHYRQTRRLDENNRVEWTLVEQGPHGHSELLVSSFDEPGLFARICGALLSKDVNILSAQIASTSDGYAVDRFLVTDYKNEALPEGFRLDRLKKDLNEVMLGKRDIAELIQRSRRSDAISPQRAEHRPSRVEFDNESSAKDTIIEIYAQDRKGLLFDIASALHRRRLSIDLARIQTGSYQVVDVFYVTDTEGNKIYPEQDLEAIRREIMKSVGASDEKPNTQEAAV